MIDARSANDNARSLSTTGLGTSPQADNGRQPPTASEITQYKLSNGKPTHATSVSEPPMGLNVPSRGTSRVPSPGGSVGQNNTEKPRGPSPRRVLKRPSTARPQGQKSSFKDDASAPLQNGTHHVSMADTSKLPASPKRKKNGFGEVIRKLFGRRSVKNRISLPAPVEHHNNVSKSPRPLTEIDLWAGPAYLYHLPFRHQATTCYVRAVSRITTIERSRFTFALRFGHTEGFSFQRYWCAPTARTTASREAASCELTKRYTQFPGGGEP